MNLEETAMTSAFPLYNPQMEHEACGVGAVIDLRAQATHRTVSDALTIVERLAHRAGSDATGTTGDGVGILTRLPHALFARWAAEAGVFLGGEGEYAVGMFFLPDDEIAVENICRIFDALAAAEVLPADSPRESALAYGQTLTLTLANGTVLTAPADAEAGAVRLGDWCYIGEEVKTALRSAL